MPVLVEMCLFFLCSWWKKKDLTVLVVQRARSNRRVCRMSEVLSAGLSFLADQWDGFGGVMGWVVFLLIYFYMSLGRLESKNE